MQQATEEPETAHGMVDGVVKLRPLHGLRAESPTVGSAVGIWTPHDPHLCSWIINTFVRMMVFRE